MSVVAARGFRAAGVAAGLKPGGALDLALVVNDGPRDAAAAVFTTNRCKANPVLWSERAAADGRLRAVVLNSGGANCFTGAQGFATTHATAEEVATQNGISAFDVLVGSTGQGGPQIDPGVILPAIARVTEALDNTDGADAAATAILTSDTVTKQAQHADAAGWTIGGMAKGTGMLAPSLATMLVVLTTDADIDAGTLGRSLRAATARTFDRLDSDGCRSTNDTVVIMASGASGVVPGVREFDAALAGVCANLAAQLINDADDADHVIAIDVRGAATENDAVDVARSLARSSLVMSAIQQRSSDWFRILAQIGTTAARFDPADIDVAINGVWVCQHSQQGFVPPVSLEDRQVAITIDLKSGSAAATVLTSDLNPASLLKNSA